MSRRISVSRAARLVGVKRGVLQQRIRAGELKAFEGEIALADLLQAYPDATVDDSSMLERVEKIIEQASFITNEPRQHNPSSSALASRVLAMSRELVKSRQLLRSYKDFVDILKYRLEALDPADRDKQPASLHDAIHEAIRGLEQSEISINQSVGNEVFLRIMTAQATLLPSGHEFFIDGSDSILDAGLRGGLALNYGCSNGNCGLCKMRVVSGEVRRTKPHDFTLTETEKGLGYMLSCSNTAVTDVVLEADEASGSFDIPQQTIVLRAKKVEHVDSPIAIVNTKTPRTNRLRFLAGQQVSISIDNIGSKTCFVASCPCDDMNLQFHIDPKDNDPVSRHLCAGIKPNNLITLNGPTGSFTLNEDSPNSLIFIAEGNGFAPVKGLIEHAMALDSAEHIYLYWITDVEPGHYLNNLCRSWHDALDNFHFTMIRPSTPEHGIQAINDTLTARHNDFSGFDFYICANSGLSSVLVETLDNGAVPVSRIRQVSP